MEGEMRMLRDTVMVGVHKIYVETWSSDCYNMLYIVYRLCRDTVKGESILYYNLPTQPGWLGVIHTHANIRYNIYHLDHFNNLQYLAVVVQRTRACDTTIILYYGNKNVASGSSPKNEINGCNTQETKFSLLHIIFHMDVLIYDMY